MHWLNIFHVKSTAIEFANNHIRLLSPLAVANIPPLYVIGVGLWKF